MLGLKFKSASLENCERVLTIRIRRVELSALSEQSWDTVAKMSSERRALWMYVETLKKLVDARGELLRLATERLRDAEAAYDNAQNSQPRRSSAPLASPGVRRSLRRRDINRAIDVGAFIEIDAARLYFSRASSRFQAVETELAEAQEQWDQLKAKAYGSVGASRQDLASEGFVLNIDRRAQGGLHVPYSPRGSPDLTAGNISVRPVP